MNRLEHKLPPPLVALCVAVLMGVAAHLTESLPIPFGVRVGLALALVGAGMALDITGIVQFRRARTTLNPLRPQAASSLVCDGVYRFTRNPMYLGLLLVLLGWAAYLASLLALVLAPLFVFYIDRFQIGPEERALSARFGREFDAYAARVRRWV